MSEEGITSNRVRPALGDVTNQIGKRGFSSIDGFNKDEGCPLAKKGNFRKEIMDFVLKPHSEVKEPCLLGVGGNVESLTDEKDSEGVKYGCVDNDDDDDDLTPVSLSGNNEIVEVKEGEKSGLIVVAEDGLKEKADNSLGVEGGDEYCLDDLGLGKDEFLDGLRFPESQESRCGFEKCVGQKGDGVSSVFMDMIKECPCSFCIKAAYLWSDLLYQDTKGRIAAIKKSQKEAAILVHQNSRNGARDFSSNLESDLTGRWKSLFLHMEDIFVHEGSQLETSLSTLKELRDNCKTDSEKK
nr:R-linalool synthase QH1, chloroplastic [Tanacetum cinerariifolium]